MNASPPEVQAVRRRGLGAFAAWPDELVAFFLANAQLSIRELLALSCTSRLMRLMVCEEPLWLQRHLHSCRRPFKYRVSLAAVLWGDAKRQSGLEMQGGRHRPLQQRAYRSCWTSLCCI